MRCKVLFGCVLALMLTIVAAPARAQVVFAGHEGHPRFSVGGGISAFNEDWGHGYMYGPTIWADWHPPLMDHFYLSNFSIEAEARDVTWDKGTHPSQFRTATVGGGLLYHARRFRFFGFEPYVKGLASFGGIDFGNGTKTTLGGQPVYSHDTRTVYALGGGLDYRVSHRITARADYEYQWWPQFLGPNSLDPRGFTFGALYNFGGHWH